MTDEARAVEYYDMTEVLNQKGEFVRWEYRAHYLKETPQEEIDRLNAMFPVDKTEEVKG